MMPFYKAGYRLGVEVNPYWPRYVPANPLKRQIFMKGYCEGWEDILKNEVAEWALNSDPIFDLRRHDPHYERLIKIDMNALVALFVEFEHFDWELEAFDKLIEFEKELVLLAGGEAPFVPVPV
jgi:hypothetical protein